MPRSPEQQMPNPGTDPSINPDSLDTERYPLKEARNEAEKITALDSNVKFRIEKRFEEFAHDRFEDPKREGLEASWEIEKRLTVPATDQKMIDKEINLEKKLPENNPLSVTEKEEEKIERQLSQLQRKRIKDFIDNNKDIFYGVPDEIINIIPESYDPNWTLRELGYLLSLPYHLQKMRQDGITHIVASATSSIPYCNLFKKLDELLYPDKEPIQFLIYSTKTEGKYTGEQNRKFIEYFNERKNVSMGAFDECASSDPHAKHNKRHTVTSIKNGLEKLLHLKVTGRYGVDTVFPSIESGKQITAGTSSHGDEGKAGCLTWMSNLIEKDETESLNLFASAYNKNGESIQTGYDLYAHGEDGLRNIEKLERLAEIAYINFSHNPDSIWNPLNFKIRLSISDDYSADENWYKEY